MALGVLTGWLDRREREAIAYLIEENRQLRRQLGGQRRRLTDDDRRRLAALAFRVGRAVLRHIATIATPTPCCDGIANWLPANGRTRGKLESAVCWSRSVS
jgi:hypothetical protein